MGIFIKFSYFGIGFYIIYIGFYILYTLLERIGEKSIKITATTFILFEKGNK